MDKKRHHYVPRAYLRAFEDTAGKIRVYMKDDPEKFIHQSPENFAFHKYYYSQPLQEGGKDNNTLEDFFSELEGKWPPIVEDFRLGHDVNEKLDDIFAFVSLQRARVPASRDANERMLAESVMAMMRTLDAQGKLEPKPAGLENILENVQVSIDPHKSLHAMVEVIRGTGTLLSFIGIGVLRNATDVPFLTSDNPVIWFDPTIPESEMLPYHVRRDGPILFLFPVAPDLCIYGDNVMREQFANSGLAYADAKETESITAINRQICRFAYRAVFSQAGGQRDLVREHAKLSPVVETETTVVDGKQTQFFRSVFGTRKRKPKWQG